MTNTEVLCAVELILRHRTIVSPRRSLLAALSGIDGSGKGHIAGVIAAEQSRRGLDVAVINVDGWLNLPSKRFSKRGPAGHFYRHALRLDEMFEQLILPLKANRSHRILLDFAEETASEFRKQPLAFEGIDIILLEGIYLFNRAYQAHYDISFWVVCSFETALERAVRRAQEGLPPDETIRAYETIYFPAQRIHFELDRPREAASYIILNGPRLSPRTQYSQSAVAAPRA